MLYNGTSYELHEALWDSHLDIPSIKNNAMAVGEGGFMSDRNIGNMLLNLMLVNNYETIVG